MSLQNIYDNYYHIRPTKKSNHNVDKWRKSIILRYGSIEAWSAENQIKAKATRIKRLGSEEAYIKELSESGRKGGLVSRK